MNLIHKDIAILKKRYECRLSSYVKEFLLPIHELLISIDTIEGAFLKCPGSPTVLLKFEAAWMVHALLCVASE
jgi:hypothetical protein